MKTLVRLIAAISLTMTISCYAYVDEKFQKLAPAGWKLINGAEPLFSDEPLQYVVLIFEKTDPANFKKNDGLGPEIFNLNPRRLVVLFKTAKGYKQILSNDKFISSEHDEDSRCLSDPLQDIEISKGILNIKFEYWLSCGSYDVTEETLKFRYDKAKNDFRLIGREEDSYSRNDIENHTYYSWNYMTGNHKVYSYGKKDEWSKMINNKPHYLSTISLKDLDNQWGN